MKLNRHLKNRAGRCLASGFTLVEMLLVLTILGILAALVFPSVARRGPEARIKATIVQIAAFKNALGLFEVENGYLPAGSSGLIALVQCPNDAPDWRGPYLDKIPQDPWGNDYIYECPGKHNATSFDLMSMGPDGKAGTPDDITNWE